MITGAHGSGLRVRRDAGLDYRRGPASYYGIVSVLPPIPIDSYVVRQPSTGQRQIPRTVAIGALDGFTYRNLRNGCCQSLSFNFSNAEGQSPIES